MAVSRCCCWHLFLFDVMGYQDLSPSASWNINNLSSYWDRSGIMQTHDQCRMAESGDCTADRP